MSAAALLDRLDKVKATAPDRWIARCPAHEDKGPSLSIREVDDKTLVYCFAGCDALDVVHAVGLELTDLFDTPPRCSYVNNGEKRGKRRQFRIPARDLLLLISHESTVVALLAADFLKRQALTEADWSRLAEAVERIGRARTHVR